MMALEPTGCSPDPPVFPPLQSLSVCIGPDCYYPAAILVEWPEWLGLDTNQMNLHQTCILVGSKQHRRWVGVDQELQVVEGKFLHILSKLLLLIHALNEEQGLGAHLRAGWARRRREGGRTWQWRGTPGKNPTLRPRTAAPRIPGCGCCTSQSHLATPCLACSSFLKSDSPCQVVLAVELGRTGSDAWKTCHWPSFISLRHHLLGAPGAGSGLKHEFVPNDSPGPGPEAVLMAH